MERCKELLHRNNWDMEVGIVGVVGDAFFPRTWRLVLLVLNCPILSHTNLKKNASMMLYRKEKDVLLTLKHRKC